MFEEELKELINSKTQAYSLLKHLNDPIFEDEIISFTKKGFKEVLWRSFPSQESRDLTILGLTFLALKYYDGALWPYVYEKFSDIFPDQKIMESKIRDGVLSLLTTRYNCERKHYQIPVMNAIVPFKYASNYIEFANDIYVKNMDCNISEYNIEEEIENVFKAIGGNLNDSDDSFKYNYEQNNSKTYKLIRATKNIIRTGFKRDELLLFTKDIIKKLDNYYRGKNVSTNCYIDESFNKWLEETQETVTTRTRTRTNFIKSKFPYFTYLNNNGTVYLHTPTKRIFGSYDPKLFSIEILEDEKMIYKNDNLRINQLLGGSEIIQCDYKIENPLNKISCKIYYDNEVIYDSKDYLFRNYMLFDDNKELKNNKAYNGIVYFIYQQNCDLRLTKLKEYDFYKISYATVCENDEFILDNKYYILFSNNIRPGVIGDGILGLDLTKQDDIIPIYKNIENIALISHNLNKSANRIKINGEFVDSTEFVEIIEQPNTIAYILNIQEMHIEANYYTIELVDIQQNSSVCKYELLYDPCIEIQQMILNDYTISFQYYGNFAITDKANRIYTDFSLLINDLDKKKLYLNINNDLYKCKFSLTVPYYKIDDGSINTFSHYLTSEDFTFQSKLFFNVSNCDKVIYKADDTINELTIKTIESKQYIELSEFINFKNCNLVEISFRSENSEKNFLRIYNNIVFDSEESYYTVDSNSEEVQFKTVLYGKKSNDIIYIRLSNRNGVIAEDIVNNYDNINVFKLGSKIQKVHYCVYRKVQSFSGFKTIESEESLVEGNFAYYPLSDLINKYLVIDKVLLQNAEDDSEMLDTQNLNLKLVKRFNEFYFLGFLYKNIKGKIESFNKIEEVLINISQVYYIDNNYCCDADISVYYEDSFEDDAWVDYLQYDANNKTLINGCSKDAPYISKYRINLTLVEKQYANFKSNRKS